MKCENCGKPLKWLYYAKDPYPASLEYESNFVEMDYAMCPECTMIYKQNIVSKVEWLPMIFGSPLTPEMKQMEPCPGDCDVCYAKNCLERRQSPKGEH